MNEPNSHIIEHKPMLPTPESEPTKEMLVRKAGRSAFRCLEALDRFTDVELEEFAKKKPKEVAIVAGILIDKVEVLQKQPEKDAVIRDERAFNEVGAMLMRIIEERGIKIEIPASLENETKREAVETIDVTPETVTIEAESEFGTWLP